MKLALKRKLSDSDSDDSLPADTNRGHKLSRRAKYIRRNHLDTTDHLSYRKSISHAGYTRSIIAANPPLYDFDGDVVSPTSSREGSPVDAYAFGGLELEKLLRPLTAASELAEHPSLGAAFTNCALTEMVREADEMVRREKEVLWRAKGMLMRFRGDVDWVPCGSFEDDGDGALLEDEGTDNLANGGSKTEVDAEAQPEDGSAGEVQKSTETEAMQAIETKDMAKEQGETGDASVAEPNLKKAEAQHLEGHPNEENDHNSESSQQAPPIDQNLPSPDRSDPPAEQPSHAMTTRTRTRALHHAASPTSPAPQSPTPTTPPEMSPWFLPPTSCHSDCDLSLPSQEAEETRRLLLLYTQKQEQIVRSLTTLHSGLARADRLRREVWRACKVEAHVGQDGKTEMSDGEDWYDVQDWGLDGEQLKMQPDGRLGLDKGKDEVEEGGDEGGEGGRRGGRRRRVNRM